MPPILRTSILHAASACCYLQNNFKLIKSFQNKPRKMASMPTAVVDVGTGYTKLGFAGNSEPEFIFQSQIGVRYNLLLLKNP